MAELDVAAAASNAAENAAALHLEDELRNTKEQLRVVIDQYENHTGGSQGIQRRTASGE